MLRRIEQAIASQHQQHGLYSQFHPHTLLDDSEREQILLWITAQFTNDSGYVPFSTC